MIDETKIMQAIRQGGSEGLALLFDAYADRIYRLAVRLLQNPVEAEDVVQETFLKALTHVEGFKGLSKLSTWLYRIAYNASIDRLRHQPEIEAVHASPEDDFDDNLMPQVFVDWETPEKILLDAESTAILDKAIASLPDTLQSVFILRDIESISTAETAEIVGVSVGTVKVRLHRARLKLREYLSETFASQQIVSGPDDPERMT